MNEGLIPRRYAKALLKVAQERGDDKRLYSLMGTLAASFEAHPDLSTAVANPFISADEKIKLLTTAAGAGDKDVTYADFLKLLRNNSRMPLVRGIALAYGEDYRRSNNIYKVEVTAAAPMDSAEESRQQPQRAAPQAARLIPAERQCPRRLSGAAGGDETGRQCQGGSQEPPEATKRNRKGESLT